MDLPKDKEPASKDRVLFLISPGANIGGPYGGVAKHSKASSALDNLVRASRLDACELLNSHPEVLGYMSQSLRADARFHTFRSHVTEQFCRARELWRRAMTDPGEHDGRSECLLFEAACMLLEDPQFGEPHADLLESVSVRFSGLAGYVMKRLRKKIPKVMLPPPPQGRLALWPGKPAENRIKALNRTEGGMTCGA